MQPEIDIGRMRLTKVFRYLEALNQKRNPVKTQIAEQPWILWYHDFPAHDSVRRGVLNFADSNAPEDEDPSSASSTLAGDDFLLKVKRPKIRLPRIPPSGLIDWLHPGWDDPFKDLNPINSKNVSGDDLEDSIERFEDNAQRVNDLANWGAIRDEWAANEKPARNAMKLFDRLYELYGRIEREAERYELVVGDGILRWDRADGGIHHPVLLKRIQLEFDPNIPEFTFRETDHPGELYTTLFRAMMDVDGKLIGKISAEMEQGSYHPLEAGGTNGFLQSFAQRLSARGQFVEQDTSIESFEHPTIYRDPVIFLRARTLGFAKAIEAILDDLRATEFLPSSLLNIVGIETLPTDIEEERVPDSFQLGNEDDDVLLSKPANKEQLQIAQRLAKYESVLVQGPPGTGKTHTIANLIGHLLAQGQSVLVTSHTDQALQEVRRQVDSKLQPLCVSVLRNDAKNRERLKSSITGIVERTTEDVEALTQHANSLSVERKQILSRLRADRQNLLHARTDEYRDVAVGGQGYPPSEAAKKVKAGNDLHDWIPSPVRLGNPLPLEAGELIDLYETNLLISSNDETELACILPEPENLLTPKAFSDLVSEWSELSTRNLEFKTELWQSGGDASEIENLLERLITAVEPLDQQNSERWIITSIAAGNGGGKLRETWEVLLHQIESTVNEAINAEEVLIRFGPRLPDNIELAKASDLLDAIISHVHSGRKLSRLTLILHSDWKQIISESRIGETTPSRVEHFEALRTLSKLLMSRQALRDRWTRQMVPLGAPNVDIFGESIEKLCVQFIEPITRHLDWRNRIWLPLENELKDIGFKWSEFFQQIPTSLNVYGDLVRLRDGVKDDLPPIFAARLGLLRQLDNDVALSELEETLFGFTEEAGGARVVSNLLDAVRTRNSESYELSYGRLIDLHRKSTGLQRRRELLRRVEAVAPAWASALRTRIPPHNSGAPPGDFEKAWLWRQLNDELDDRAGISIEALQTSLEGAVLDLQRTTTELIEYRSWAAQVRRTGLAQRMALVGWLQLNKRIGAGTGLRVPRLQAEARKAMEQSRDAVPVWIMPLSRVVENFDPTAGLFDVVIIDEASQSDAMALIALYMGKRVVVVGDDEQVSPEAVGERVLEVQNLIDQHLEGIRNKDLYDGKMSVYDLALQSFRGAIVLREHFRCVPEIIQFSNFLSYNGKIEPLRDPSGVRQRPHVIEYCIPKAVVANKINKEEALTVASLIVAAIEQPEYEGQTFGAISLLGADDRDAGQSREIQTLLTKNLSPVEFVKREIRCGNAARFQGGERDVMFLSLVDNNAGEGTLPIRTQPLFKKRYNVAASRARNQMWVVHSLQPDHDLKDGDLRRRIIEFARDPEAVVRAFEKEKNRTESEFERLVLQRLIAAGYNVKSQWKVGSHRIDLVVSGGGSRLAVECDGDRWHPLDKLPDDMSRQAILERLGWKFVSIRGSEFFRNPHTAMQPIFDKLRSLGISPELTDVEPAANDPVHDELKQRVIRRAEEIRQSWFDANVSLDSRDSSSATTTQRSSRLTIQDNVTPLTDSVLNPQASSPARDLFGELSTENDGSLESAPVDSQRPIGQISLLEIRRALETTLPINSSIERTALTTMISRALGYRRMGRKIRSRLNKAIYREIREGRLEIDPDGKIMRPAAHAGQ
jgi:very-short-patch-repair endonuclease